MLGCEPTVRLARSSAAAELLESRSQRITFTATRAPVSKSNPA